MKKLICSLTLVALIVPGAASANHIYTDTPFATYGECESENARLSNDDAERQFPLRPDLFSNFGEARSLLTRAFSCELDEEDGYWYLIDHRREAINSDWFQRRI